MDTVTYSSHPCGLLTCPYTACIGVGCVWHPIHHTPSNVDLTTISTDQLLNEIRRRMH